MRIKVELVSGVVLLFSLWTTAIAQEENYDYLCNRTTVLRNAGYNRHPSRCDLYIQCHLNVNGNYIAEVRQCPFATHWSMDLKTCLRSTATTCVVDPCADKPDGHHRPGVGNCRGYWECVRGKTIAQCCPQGQYFNPTGGCMNNTEKYNCTATCFDEFNKLNNNIIDNSTPEPVPFNCDKKSIPGDPSMYEQFVVGFDWKMIRPCSLGTEFVQHACNCIASAARIIKESANLNNPIQRPTAWGSLVCKPTLDLPFTVDHRDTSGNGINVRNENVIVQNGVAHFNGVNSRLIIDTFPDIGITNTLILKIKYSSNHGSIPAHSERAILSNDNCQQKPSLILSETKDSVHSTLGTWAFFSISTEVPLPQMPPRQALSAKNVVFKMTNAEFSTQVGNTAAKTSVFGNYRNIRCPLHIGTADSLLPFKGEIDEIQIYVCDPTQRG